MTYINSHFDCAVSALRLSAIGYRLQRERSAVLIDQNTAHSKTELILRQVYQASTLEQAKLGLEAFCKAWDQRYPMMAQAWLRHQERITPMFAFPPEVRKMVYTTNAIESLKASLRCITSTNSPEGAHQ